MATVSDIEAFTPDITSRYGEGLTQEVTTFILETRYEDIPEEVIDLSKKSILDGLGLALSGSVAESGRISKNYLESLGLSGETTVIGTELRVPERFAAFANGIGVHADDYDDTQLRPGLRTTHSSDRTLSSRSFSCCRETRSVWERLSACI